MTSKLRCIFIMTTYWVEQCTGLSICACDVYRVAQKFSNKSHFCRSRTFCHMLKRLYLGQFCADRLAVNTILSGVLSASEKVSIKVLQQRKMADKMAAIRNVCENFAK